MTKGSYLIAITGDKGGVGKSTLALLLVEWLIHQGEKVEVIDADPNQSVQTWIDKCKEQGRGIVSSSAPYTVVDTAGTSGSGLVKYIRNADLILVPFKPHVADLEVVVGWFLSLKESLQERVLFVPNMMADTKEQRAGVAEINNVVEEEGRGAVLTGLHERKAVYPPLFNGSKENFFAQKLDAKTLEETTRLFAALTTYINKQ
jgi:chromosome partitioning protein